MSDKVPDTTTDERKLGAAKAAVSAIPLVGGPAAELLELAIRPQIEARRTAWLNDLASRLSDLEERVDSFSISDLANDPVFATAMLQASSISVRNHNEDKLDALRNAVLNTAVSTSRDEDEQALFLSLIDNFTPWHLRILAFLADKEGVAESRGKLPWPSWHSGGVSSVLEHVYPELAGGRDLYDLVAADLNRAGLIIISGLHATGTRDGYMLANQSSELGDRFLLYISDPGVN